MFHSISNSKAADEKKAIPTASPLSVLTSWTFEGLRAPSGSIGGLRGASWGFGFLCGASWGFVEALRGFVARNGTFVDLRGVFLSTRPLKPSRLGPQNFINGPEGFSGLGSLGAL